MDSKQKAMVMKTLREWKALGIKSEDIIVCLANSISKTTSTELNAESTLESRVSSILDDLCVPVNNLGYHYLRYAIVLCVEKPELIYALTKKLYPTVAAKYATAQSRVERAMRMAIETSWKKCDPTVRSLYFSYQPTNSLFIATIAHKL